MNRLLFFAALDAHKERMRMRKCLYCGMAFNSPRVLAGHLMALHSTEISEGRNLHYPVRCFDTLDLSGINLSQLVATQLENSFRILCNTPFFYGDNLSAGINWSALSCPHEPGMFNAGNFANANPSLVVPPKHSVASDGAQVHPSNIMFSASTASPVDGGPLNTFSSPAVTGFLSVSIMCPHHAGYPNPVADAHSAPSLNQPPGFNDPAYGFVPQGLTEDEYEDEDEYDLSDEDNPNSDISGVENASSLVGSMSFTDGVSEDGNMVSSPEEPNLSLHPMIQSENPQPKELLLFKDPKLPFPGPGNSDHSEAAGHRGLDLSLCL